MKRDQRDVFMELFLGYQRAWSEGVTMCQVAVRAKRKAIHKYNKSTSQSQKEVQQYRYAVQSRLCTARISTVYNANATRDGTDSSECSIDMRIDVQLCYSKDTILMLSTTPHKKTMPSHASLKSPTYVTMLVKYLLGLDTAFIAIL